MDVRAKEHRIAVEQMAPAVERQRRRDERRLDEQLVRQVLVETWPAASGGMHAEMSELF